VNWNDDIDVLTWAPLTAIQFVVDYDGARHVEAGPAGGRSLFPVTGGSFEGRISGTVEPHGADWVQWRPDGVMQIDVRVMLRTHDDALIAMTYTGLTYAEPEVMQRFLKREPYEFGEAYSRVTPRFETGDERYTWLNRTIAVANGMRTPGVGPIYRVFAIT
jgi:hypothetical protein